MKFDDINSLAVGTQIMKIREARTCDIVSLRRLNTEVQNLHIEKFPNIFKETSPDEIDKWLKSQIEADNVYFSVAIDNDEIIGYAILRLVFRQPNPFMHARKFAYIDHVCVTESRRKLGVGKKLIEDSIKYAGSRDYEQVELDVWSENEVAKKSFENLGFETYCEKKVLRRSAQQGAQPDTFCDG